MNNSTFVTSSASISETWPDSQQFWGQRRICVTGGGGFLGSFVYEQQLLDKVI